MRGNNVTYEASYESPLVKKYSKKLNISEEIEVNPVAAFGNASIMGNMRTSMAAKKRNDVFFNAKLNTLCQTVVDKRAS